MKTVRITFQAVVTEAAADKLKTALEEAVKGARSTLRVEPLSGPIEPDEWLADGPAPVIVEGVWETYGPIVRGVDYDILIVIMELAIGTHHIRLMGYPYEGASFRGMDWEIPGGAGEILHCDEDLAKELLESLANQVYHEFGAQPAPVGLILEAEVIN